MIQATENLRFGDLISRRVPFEVPKYQRTYAWEEDEVLEFINDIKDLYKLRNESKIQTMNHFFGGIVSVNRTVANTYTGRVYDVVDGQQRLTTFLLTIAAIIEGLERVATEAQIAGDNNSTQKARSYADTTRTGYVDYDEVINGVVQRKLRLQLSKSDNMFFENLINNHNEARSLKKFQKPSHKRLNMAWKNIWDNLIDEPILSNTKILIDEKVDKLVSLRTCLTEDCNIIHIVSDNLNEAYRLFSVLNDRGKTLSDGDLLRSYTLEVLEGFTSQQYQVESAWDKITSRKTGNVDQFLRAYYTSFDGMRAPKRDLARKFYEKIFNGYKHLDPLKSSDNGIANIVQNGVLSLSDEYDIFENISDGDWPYDPHSVKEWDKYRINRLVKILKHTVCRPLLLSAHKNLSEEQFSDLIQLLERFSFRYITIVGAHAEKLGEIYNDYARLIRSNPSSYKIENIKSDLYSLQQNHAPDSLFEPGIREKLIYLNPNIQNNTSMKILIRYFLTTIEDYLSWFNSGAKGQPKPDKSRIFALDQVTIEHIYPQNPKPGDMDLKLEPYKHTIGNLSFWGPGENSVAGNANFNNKRINYTQSHVMLNRELVKISNWDENALMARRDRLVDIAKKIFTAQ